jgi:hypothetical protein
MSSSVQINYNEKTKNKERIFFLCEDCMWGLTCLDRSRLFEVIGEDGICPLCHQDQLSSFPLVLNHSFTYCYKEKSGIEVKFDNKRPVKQISQIKKA